MKIFICENSQMCNDQYSGPCYILCDDIDEDKPTVKCLFGKKNEEDKAKWKRVTEPLLMLAVTNVNPKTGEHNFGFGVCDPEEPPIKEVAPTRRQRHQKNVEENDE